MAIFGKKYPGFFRKIIHIILISEFILTAIGFCGHSHEHLDTADKPDHQCTHYVENGAVKHFHVHAKSHDATAEEHSHDKFCCTCYGGYIGILIRLNFDNILVCSSLISTEKTPYKLLWSPLIYHPPTQFCK